MTSFSPQLLLEQRTSGTSKFLLAIHVSLNQVRGEILSYMSKLDAYQLQFQEQVHTKSPGKDRGIGVSRTTLRNNLVSLSGLSE